MTAKYKTRARIRPVMDQLFDIEPGNRLGKVVTGYDYQTIHRACRQWVRDNRIPGAKFKAAMAEDGVRVWRERQMFKKWKKNPEPKFYGFDMRALPRKPFKVIEGRRTLAMISPRVTPLGYLPRALSAVASIYSREK